MNSDELRAAYNACLPKLSDYASEVGQNPDLYRGYKRVSEQAGLERRPAQDAAEHAARPAPGRRRPAGGQEGPLPRDQPGTEPTHQQVRRERARRHQRLAQADHSDDRLAGLPAAAKALARQHAKERDLDGWVLDAGLSVLRAGHALRRRPRPAPRGLRGLHHPRLRPGPARRPVGQQRGHGTRSSRCATSRRSCSASQLRRAVPGAEDGPRHRRGHGLSQRPGRTLRGPGPRRARRAQDLRPVRARRRRHPALGPGLLVREAAPAPLFHQR
jgi:hypothetical protein